MIPNEGDNCPCCGDIFAAENECYCNAIAQRPCTACAIPAILCLGCGRTPSEADQAVITLRLSERRVSTALHALVAFLAGDAKAAA